MVLILGLVTVVMGVGAGNAEAKDLFVAPGGSDSVSYAGNDINNPWATPQKAWYSAQAGDTVFFRQGRYTISTMINTKSSGNNGTADSPITFRNFEGEEVTFASSLARVFNIEKNYTQVRGIRCEGGGTFFYVGYDTSATNFKYPTAPPG